VHRMPCAAARGGARHGPRPVGRRPAMPPRVHDAVHTRALHSCMHACMRRRRRGCAPWASAGPPPCHHVCMRACVHAPCTHACSMHAPPQEGVRAMGLGRSEGAPPCHHACMRACTRHALMRGIMHACAAAGGGARRASAGPRAPAMPPRAHACVHAPCTHACMHAPPQEAVRAMGLGRSESARPEDKARIMSEVGTQHGAQHEAQHAVQHGVGMDHHRAQHGAQHGLAEATSHEVCTGQRTSGGGWAQHGLVTGLSTGPAQGGSREGPMCRATRGQHGPGMLGDPPEVSLGGMHVRRHTFRSVCMDPTRLPAWSPGSALHAPTPTPRRRPSGRWASPAWRRCGLGHRI
jgi:hypothetical protein